MSFTRFQNQNSDEIFSGLNPEQQEAVLTTKGPVLILAGAGTGKTLVITRRIAYLLLQQIPADSILAVTFTKKAATEMRERVQALLGGHLGSLTICTFHSLGLRMLREHGHRLGLSRKVGIVDTIAQLKLIETILDEIDPEGEFSAVNLLSRISAAKNKGVTPAMYLRRELDESSRRAVLVYARYEAELKKRGALDLDDLILLPLTMLREHTRMRNFYLRRFRYILIDEYQDTNRGQYLFAHQLIGEDRNVCVVGDDDQSIYRFRGAEVGNILRFEHDFAGAKAVTLERNYRSTEPVINLANAVIERAKQRYPKRLVSDVGAGLPVRWRLLADDEAEGSFLVAEIKRLARTGTPYPDIAILQRVQGELRSIEAHLRKHAIPCGRSVRGVTLMTLHAAKGLEFPVVFLPALEDGVLPHFHALQEGSEALEEERRLLYVGITRAKRQLVLTSAASRAAHGREPSRFLREISEKGVLHVE